MTGTAVVLMLLGRGWAGCWPPAMELRSLNKDRSCVTRGTAHGGGQHDLDVTEARRSVRGGTLN